MLCSENILPQSLVRCFPIGVISMLDQGKNDDKIVAVPFNDPVYNTYSDVFQLPQHVMDEMAHFFTVYKSLEQKDTVIDEIRGPKAAKAIIQRALDAYVDKFCR